ncbi:TonB-dependent receptor [Phenylobacterium sp. LjRoot219]|uniref:TonB-dependent receptor n=1 Tax=Phenylobacterium sp. LjRoot219 TaxID=3342283 RepID=UPI003ECC355B
MRRGLQRSFARRAGLLASAAALIVAGPAWAADVDAAVEASAAATAEAEAIALDEVVVTAQKRATNLQETPISMAVMGSEALANRHIQSLGDLSDGAIPSLRIAPFFSRSSALLIGMRGIGVGDANQPARDQAVGVYIDGVYLGRAQGLGSALYDVERIEVLKGPQGTLFGRNTEAGAISIVTRDPTGEFGVDMIAGYGNYNSYKAEAHVNLPEFHDVAVKLDGLITKRDGTVKNPTTSGQQDFNAFDRKGFHGQALWRPTDAFRASYAFDYSYDATTPYYLQVVSKGSLPLAPANPAQPDRAENSNVGVPLQWSVGKTWGHHLNLDWRLSETLTLKSISAYRKLDQSQYDNAPNLSPFFPNGTFSRYSLAQVNQEQYSQEFQAIGELDHFEFAAGAFYYHEKVRDNAQAPNTMQWNATGTAYTTLSLDLNAVQIDRAAHVTTESYGVFGQAVYTPPVLDERVHLTVGGRFTHDAKKGSLDTVNGALPSYVDASGVRVTGVIPLDDSWDRFDPLVVLAGDLADNVNVYGKWSTGYKSGGGNTRSLTFRAFDPEKVSMFEVGAKTEFWERRGRFNIAAFYGDLKDAQVDFTVLIIGNNRTTQETTNSASGTTKGVEIDGSIQPVDGLTLSASYAYTDIELSDAFNPFTNSIATVYPTYAPKNAASISADYERPAFGALLRAHLDGNYSDGQYSTPSDPTLSDDSFIVNGRLALSDIRLTDAATLEVSLWSRNLFDEEHLFVKSFSSALGAYGIFNDPRTFGVEAKLQY